MTPRVLIIEDEATLAGAIEAFLRRQGAATRSFAAGETALAALAEVAPDVALVDLHLTGRDGLAVLEAIRAERPETLVIVMTAYSTVSWPKETLRYRIEKFGLGPERQSRVAPGG